MKLLKNFNLKQKRVLVRCDFNVPLAKSGLILDDFRIRQTLPTIKYLIGKKAKVILISHLGRPKEIKNRVSIYGNEGEEEGDEDKSSSSSFAYRSENEVLFAHQKLKIKKLSLKPVALRLEKLLKRKVSFLEDCLSKKAGKETKKMKPGSLILLENLRFYKEEEENNQDFAKKLAKLAEIFINDALSVCHRAHASIVGITKYLPSGAGFLLEKEIKILSGITKSPKRPLVVIIGGKKVEDKAKVVERFSKIADYLLLGNLVADKIEENKIKIKNLKKIIFPVDSNNNFDIGEKTIKIFKEKILKAKTIFWAGPLGKIEEKKYRKGTREVARVIIKSGAFSVVGGGDTIEFINQIGLIKKFNHASIGGGAMLHFLAGEKLPGLQALK